MLMQHQLVSNQLKTTFLTVNSYVLLFSCVSDVEWFNAYHKILLHVSGVLSVLHYNTQLWGNSSAIKPTTIKIKIHQGVTRSPRQRHVVVSPLPIRSDPYININHTKTCYQQFHVLRCLRVHLFNIEEAARERKAKEKKEKLQLIRSDFQLLTFSESP